MTHADHAPRHGEGRVTRQTGRSMTFPPIPRPKEGEVRYLCKSCPHKFFWSGSQLRRHVERHREACDDC